MQCWASVKQQVTLKDKSLEAQIVDETPFLIADIEILNMIRVELSDPSHKVITSNQVESVYRSLLSAYGTKTSDRKKSYKPYLKQLIEEHLPNVSFQNSPRVNEPERICSNAASSQALDNVIKQSKADNFNELFNVSKIIRKELEHHEKWQFKGSFDDFSAPIQLSTLIRWILVGPNQEFENKSRESSIEKNVSIVAQMIIQLFKTRRQVNCQAVEESNRGMYQNIETPLSVGLGLYIHQRTRSKELLDMFSETNLSISSKKVACIKRDIETAVREKVHDSDGIFIPSTISPSNDVYSAVDNTDMRIDTADGQHQLHGTAMALYQKETGLPADNSTQIINRSSRLEKRQSATPFYESQFCPEPKRENVKYNSYTEFVTHDYFE